MSNDEKSKGASQRYSEAHGTHYGTQKLREALGLYMDIITEYPESREADFSRSQIHNIVKAVVPKWELIKAEEALALAHIEPLGSAG